MTFTFTFLSLTTNDRERGYLSINTESNSININAYIPKQAGSTHKPLSLKEKQKKKKKARKRKVPCQRTQLESSLGPRFLASSAQKEKRRKSEVRVHKSSIPHGGGFN